MQKLFVHIKRFIHKLIYFQFDRKVLSGQLIITQDELRQLSEGLSYDKSQTLVFDPERHRVIGTKKIPTWIRDFTKPRAYRGSFFTLLNNAEIVGSQGTVVYQGKFVLDSILNSLGYLLTKSEKRLLLLQKTLPIKERYSIGLSLANCLSNSYFHWVGETLPMLEALFEWRGKERNIQPVTIFLSANAPKFAYEYLFLFGIKADQIVELTSQKIFIEQLIVPSTRFFILKNPHDIWSRHIYPKSAFDFLRIQLHSQINQDKKLPRKIYLSRKDATVRNVVNEKEVINFLKANDYEQISMDNLSVQKQIQLFTQITHLVAPHGAGLANTLFSTAINILEFFPKTRAFGYNYHYYQISCHYHHHHTMLLCDCDKDQNMIVDLAILADLLQE